EFSRGRRTTSGRRRGTANFDIATPPPAVPSTGRPALVIGADYTLLARAFAVRRELSRHRSCGRRLDYGSGVEGAAGCGGIGLAHVDPLSPNALATPVHSSAPPYVPPARHHRDSGGRRDNQHCRPTIARAAISRIR